MRITPRRGLLSVAFLSLAAALAAGFWGVPLPVRGAGRAKVDLAKLPTQVVRRTDLSVALTAGGKVESTKNTVVECELERLQVRVQGKTFDGGGASTILSVVKQGETVRKGDVLCVLDSSDYEEMVRQQQMVVERAQADKHQAELKLEVAKMAVEQFRNGIYKQTVQDYQGRIALAKSDLRRSDDRVRWVTRMVGKGYLSSGQLISERINQARSSLSKEQMETGLRIFENYTFQKTLKQLEGAVHSAEATLTFETKRLQRSDERLENLQKQVERCTIRAPHDGFVVYATDSRRQITIEPGTTVRQNQDLFLLPDLANMEVLTLLHESIADEVSAGMLAKVRVDGMPDRILEGHVESVSQLPLQQSYWSDVRYFVGHVLLDSVPQGLRPGMSAEVQVTTALRPGVLTIPTEALAVELGRDVCYVRNEDGLERREVRLGSSTHGMHEVVEGLEDGEEVVIDPSRYDASSVAIAETLLPGGGEEDTSLAQVAATN